MNWKTVIFANKYVYLCYEHGYCYCLATVKKTCINNFTDCDVYTCEAIATSREESIPVKIRKTSKITFSTIPYIGADLQKIPAWNNTRNRERNLTHGVMSMIQSFVKKETVIINGKWETNHM